MKTKKATKIIVGLLLISGAAGLSLAEMKEYGEVAIECVGKRMRDEIPLSVEIERMDVLLKKLNRQVDSQKYTVAKAKVALEDAEANLAYQQSTCTGLVTEMKLLRNLGPAGSCGTIQVGCHHVSAADVQQALAFKLAAWKESTAVRAAHEKLLDQQRMAFRKLTEKFTEWQSQRELLAHRLETLRARNHVQLLSSDTDTSVFNDADLARTTELADQIEKELRIVEVQQELGTSPIDHLLAEETQPATNVEAEVDAILDQQSQQTAAL